MQCCEFSLQSQERLVVATDPIINNKQHACRFSVIHENTAENHPQANTHAHFEANRILFLLLFLFHQQTEGFKPHRYRRCLSSPPQIPSSSVWPFLASLLSRAPSLSLSSHRQSAGNERKDNCITKNMNLEAPVNEAAALVALHSR